MHWAAIKGSLDVLEFLLSQGASVDAHDPDPQSTLVAHPLHWAAINGHLVFCKVLLDNGAQVDPRGGELNATPMMWAAKYRFPLPLRLIRELMEGTDKSILCTYYYNTAQIHL
jgi:palmitoyltransferase ZDHHC13/17